MPRPPDAPNARSSAAPRPGLRLSRRDLLRGFGVLGAAGLLAACGGDGSGTGNAGQDATGGGGTGQTAGSGTEDPRQAILQELGIDAPLELVLVIPTPEFAPGDGQHLLFGLATPQREFLNDLEVEVTLVRDDDFSVVTGPTPAETHEGFGEFTIYDAKVDFPEAGIYRVAIEAPDQAGVGAIQVLPPDQSLTPRRGQQLPSAPTATTDDPRGLEDICTREPDCSMHAVSLEEALNEGRPIVLSVATPAFCQTAICGPVVDVIEQVKQDAGRDDVAWIHAEVYKDAGNTPVQLMQDLGLRSEPWTFFVGADGVVADRLGGPTPAPLVRELLDKI